jgi:hypothetical protein
MKNSFDEKYTLDFRDKDFHKKFLEWHEKMKKMNAEMLEEARKWEELDQLSTR